jgi:hypothetical protein
MSRHSVNGQPGYVNGVNGCESVPGRTSTAGYGSVVRIDSKKERVSRASESGHLALSWPRRPPPLATVDGVDAVDQPLTATITRRSA